MAVLVTNNFSISNQNLEFLFGCHENSNHVIITKLCTWHDNCVEMCTDIMASYRNTVTEYFFFKFEMIKISLMKWAPRHETPADVPVSKGTKPSTSNANHDVKFKFKFKYNFSYWLSLFCNNIDFFPCQTLFKSWQDLRRSALHKLTHWGWKNGYHLQITFSY